MSVSNIQMDETTERRTKEPEQELERRGRATIAGERFPVNIPEITTVRPYLRGVKEVLVHQLQLAHVPVHAQRLRRPRHQAQVQCHALPAALSGGDGGILAGCLPEAMGEGMDNTCHCYAIAVSPPNSLPYLEV
jgi:hypothetical protein